MGFRRIRWGRCLGLSINDITIGDLDVYVGRDNRGGRGSFKFQQIQPGPVGDGQVDVQSQPGVVNTELAGLSMPPRVWHTEPHHNAYTVIVVRHPTGAVRMAGKVADPSKPTAAQQDCVSGPTQGFQGWSGVARCVGHKSNGRDLIVSVNVMFGCSSSSTSMLSARKLEGERTCAACLLWLSLLAKVQVWVAASISVSSVGTCRTNCGVVYVVGFVHGSKHAGSGPLPTVATVAELWSGGVVAQEDLLWDLVVGESGVVGDRRL